MPPEFKAGEPKRTDKSVESGFIIPDDDQELNLELTRLAGHINAAQYRFLKLLAALVDREAWGGTGIKSPAHWLNYYCGIDLGAAREKVRVAKCLGSLPKIDEAFRTGTISYSKVRAMTRAATPETEDMLLNVAQNGTAHHVEQLVRKFERCKRISDPQHDAATYEAREFTWFYDDDGMLVFNGRLTAEDGAVFLKAMEAMFNQVMEGQRERGREKEQEQEQEQELGDERELEHDSEAKNVSAETSTPKIPELTLTQRRADVLVALAEQAQRSLSSGLKPMAPAEKFQVVVHIEQASLNADKASIPQCSLETNGSQLPISPQAVKRLCCDTSLLTVLEDEKGNVLNVGRKTRSIPPAIKRALSIRDKGCRFPGCCESRYVDAHHIKHWCDGGETKLDNLILLCRRHHTLLHQAEYQIIKDEEGMFQFVDTEAKKIPRTLWPQFQYGDGALERLAIEREHQRLGLEIRDTTAIPHWCGERLDYSWVIGGMMDVLQRGRLMQ